MSIFKTSINLSQFRNISRLCPAFILFLAAIWLVVFPIRDYDTFWHLANGRAMLEQGTIINEEIFSYSARGTTFTNHSWLAQIVMYLFFSISDTTGLLIYKIVLTAGVFWFVFQLATLFEAKPTLAALAGFTAIFTGLGRYVARPQLFAYLALAFLAWVLFSYVKGRYGNRILWSLPPVFILWDTLHGPAVYGFAFWGMFNIAETIKFYWFKFRPETDRRLQSVERHSIILLWTWLVITFAAVLFKPMGQHLYLSILELTRDNYIFAMTGEFVPTFKMGITFWPFWTLVGISTLLFLVNWRKFDLTWLLILIPFTYLGIRYNRSVAVYAIVAAPVVAGLISTTFSKFRLMRFERYGPASAFILIIVILVLTFQLKGMPLNRGELDPSGIRTGSGINRAFLPMGAIDFILSANLQGNMYNADRFGGLFSYYLAPDRPIFHYNHPLIFQDIYQYLHDPGSRKQWNHNYAIVAKAEEVRIFSEQGWVTVYRDPSAMVLVANNSLNADVIKRYRINHFNPLASNAEIKNQLKKTWVYKSLVREISDYLSFNQSERFCNILVEFLSGNTDLPIELKRTYALTARKNNQKSPSLLGYLGLLAYRSGELDEAFDYFQRANSFNQSSRFIRINLGFIEIDRHNNESAIEIFQALINKYPEDADAIFGLARALAETGKINEAKRLSHKYLKIAPKGRFANDASILIEK